MRQCLLILWSLILLTGCGKLPINGDLDGQWQILEIRYADGRIETPERAYYCVQLHTITLRQVNGPNQTGNMVYEGDQLSLLRVFGLDDTKETFTVTELSSSRLVLTSDYARISFRKF